MSEGRSEEPKGFDNTGDPVTSDVAGAAEVAASTGNEALSGSVSGDAQPLEDQENAQDGAVEGGSDDDNEDHGAGFDVPDHAEMISSNDVTL